MPNHVENDLYLSGPADQIAALLEFIGMGETLLGSTSTA